MPEIVVLVLSVIGVSLVVIFGLFAIIKAFYVKVPQGTALILNDTTSKPKVFFTGKLVLPVIHKKEFMKISLLTLLVDRRGKEGLICKDNLRADIAVAFYIRVNETTEDVLKVAKSIGVDRASDHHAVSELFSAKFSEALKTVGKQFDLAKLFEDRLNFRERIVDVIGKDLNGYALEDVAIDYLEQTPIGHLDPNNIFDAEGINKITAITAVHKDETNKRERDLELALKKKDTETFEAKLELERQQADAEARQKREIETIRARELAETLKVQEEERLKAEQARIISQQEIEVREENRQREVEVAQQNRMRAVAIEEERVTRARELEVVAREREIELQTIEKDKAVEEEKRIIADVIRERISVEKTVAIEEERIKEVREISAAEREKQTKILAAQAKAEEELVKQVKQAEADETAAKHRAVEISTIAQANLEAATKDAEAQKRMAEGTEAEQAAIGLAEARVMLAKAEAEEKEGMVQAFVAGEMRIAEAKGIQEKGSAEAKAIQDKGLAEAKVVEAKATAVEKQGLVEASIIREKLRAEAEGLVEKFHAMGTMTEDSRAHEEFRLALEKGFEQAMASISANQEIAREQADVLGAALSNAKMEIVGGNDKFFESFSKAISVGKAIEGSVNQSPILQTALQTVLSRIQAPAQNGGADATQGNPLNNVDLNALATQFLGYQANKDRNDDSVEP